LKDANGTLGAGFFANKAITFAILPERPVRKSKPKMNNERELDPRMLWAKDPITL
jgi:hypothetical protein